MAGAHNEFGGQATNVIQIGTMYGDIGEQVRRGQSARTQLRRSSPHFTNNERQLDEVDAVVAGLATDGGPKIVVFRAPPGGGKSATARESAHRHAGGFPDGQFYVPLAAGTGETCLESTFLREFLLAAGYAADEIPESVEQRSAWFQSWSTGKRVIVVIDDALTPAQVRLLSPGPGPSLVLVTEAGRLGGLRASEDATFVDITPMSPESARLLLGRIVDKERIAAEPDPVAELIGLCEGSVLALCVVASMLAEFPERRIARLVRELSDEQRRIAVLSKDPGLSVTAVLNTAYGRLDGLARRCYVALGQHPGTSEVSAAALIAALDEDPGAVRDALDELLAARLAQEPTEDRFAAHSLVRLHARECGAEDRQQADGIRTAFAGFYRNLATVAGHRQMPGRGWFERLLPDVRIDQWPHDWGDPWQWLETERPTLRALVDQEFADGHVHAVCQLAVALWPLHERGKHAGDMIAVNEQGVRAARELGDRAVESLLRVQCGFGRLLGGEFDEAFATFEAAIAPAREAGDEQLEATALESMGMARFRQQRVAEARELLRRNLDLARRIGHPRRIALALLHLGRAEQTSKALPVLDESLAIFRAEGTADGEHNAAKVLLERGKALTAAGEFENAEVALTEALGGLGTPFERGQAFDALAGLARAAARPNAAQRYDQEALSVYLAHGFREQADAVRDRMS